MQEIVYAFKTYRDFLRNQIDFEAQGKRGVKQRLAHAMQIQPAYLSLVLKDQRHLSVEQIIPVIGFFGLSQEEGEYLINLLEIERCSNPAARRFLERSLKDKRTKFSDVKARVKIREELSDSDKATYYSSYLYGAVQMAVTIPTMRTAQAIAELLQQPESKVRDALNFLSETNLVQKTAEGYTPSQTQMFVPKSSPFVVTNHRNWRDQAVNSSQLRRDTDYHFTAAFSVSHADADYLREQLAKLTETMVARIKDSKEEQLNAICLDFFRV